MKVTYLETVSQQFYQKILRPLSNTTGARRCQCSCRSFKGQRSQLRDMSICCLMTCSTADPPSLRAGSPPLKNTTTTPFAEDHLTTGTYQSCMCCLKARKSSFYTRRQAPEVVPHSHDFFFLTEMHAPTDVHQ